MGNTSSQKEEPTKNVPNPARGLGLRSTGDPGQQRSRTQEQFQRRVHSTTTPSATGPTGQREVARPRPTTLHQSRGLPSNTPHSTGVPSTSTGVPPQRPTSAAGVPPKRPTTATGVPPSRPTSAAGVPPKRPTSATGVLPKRSTSATGVPPKRPTSAAGILASRPVTGGKVVTSTPSTSAAGVLPNPPSTIGFLPRPAFYGLTVPSAGIPPPAQAHDQWPLQRGLPAAVALGPAMAPPNTHHIPPNTGARPKVPTNKPRTDSRPASRASSSGQSGQRSESSAQASDKQATRPRGGNRQRQPPVTEEGKQRNDSSNEGSSWSQAAETGEKPRRDRGRGRNKRTVGSMESIPSSIDGSSWAIAAETGQKPRGRGGRGRNKHTAGSKENIPSSNDGSSWSQAAETGEKPRRGRGRGRNKRTVGSMENIPSSIDGSSWAIAIETGQKPRGRGGRGKNKHTAGSKENIPREGPRQQQAQGWIPAKGTKDTKFYKGQDKRFDGHAGKKWEKRRNAIISSNELQTLEVKDTEEIKAAVIGGKFQRLMNFNNAHTDQMYHALHLIQELIKDDALPPEESLHILAGVVESRMFKINGPIHNCMKFLVTRNLKSQNKGVTLGFVVGTLCLVQEMLLRLPIRSSVIVTGVLPDVEVLVNWVMFDLVRVPELTKKLDEVKKLHEDIRNRMDQGDQIEDEVLDLNWLAPNDYRRISVMPTLEDLNEECPFIEENRMSGYDSPIHYLDTQFRLMREDLIAPLRQGIKEHLNNVSENRVVSRLQDGFLYRDVKFLGLDTKNDRSLAHIIQFSIANLQKVQWENTKRLMFGNMVCLSADNFESVFFGVIADRDPKSLRRGILSITIEGITTVPLAKRHQNFVMIEATSYLEAYKYVLERLQNIGNEVEIGRALPFQRHIVDCEPEVAPPAYLKTSTEIKLKSPKGTVKTVTALRESSWATLDAASLGLDDSQFQALKHTLCSEMALIQGPPGTGKTFIGLKVMEILLENRQMWKDLHGRGHIMIICFTNHALDQFLEGIDVLETETRPTLVRIGGRCKTESLTKYTLKELREKYRKTRSRQHRQLVWHIRTEMDDISKEITQNKQLLSLAPRQLPFQYLLQHMTLSQRCSFSTDSTEISISANVALLRWLVGWDGIDELTWHTTIRQVTGPDVVEGELPQSQRRVTGKVRNEEPCSVPETRGDAIDEKTQEDKAISEEKGAEEDSSKGNSYTDTPGVVDKEMNLDDSRKMPDGAGKVEEDSTDGEVDSDAESVISVVGEADLIQNERVLDDDYSGLSDALKSYMQDEEEVPEAARKADPNEHRKQWGKRKRQYTVEEQLDMYLDQNLATAESLDQESAANFTNVWHVPKKMRFCLFQHWYEAFYQDIDLALAILLQERNSTAEELSSLYLDADCEIIGNQEVIGLTTTGAAKYSNIIQRIQPRIVIVEEAAEVLEAHIVTALSPSCQHLILIGDHKQLRPNPTVYELARDFQLNISLFERMGRNDMEMKTLRLQHRMRPDISKLLVPWIYEVLVDHDVVKNYPDVHGIEANVIFFDHDHFERGSSESRSHSNDFEADMVVGLCKYLLQQTYTPSQITILTTYTGQMFNIRNRMKKTDFEGVRVTPVDNFQGEENDIIILSFVRSNAQNNIGFLKEPNRVCVAMSRAKQGFYAFGNFSMYEKKSETWRGMVGDMRKHGFLQKSIPLYCQIHPENKTKIEEASDFKNVPEGGCSLPCDTRLKCGHVCTKQCHIQDIDHKDYKCKKPCKKQCKRGHICRKKCWQPCRCTEPCPEVLGCGHTCQGKCGDDCCTKRCLEMCGKVLECGHDCQKRCSDDCDPCERPCRKVKACGHQCKGRCCEDCSTLKCKAICKKPLDCGHTCMKRCWEECKPCVRPCQRMKLLVCGHACKGKCGENCDEVKCKVACRQKLECGHRCRKKCFEDCNSTPCDAPCESLLPCDHICRNKCGETCLEVCQVAMQKKAPCGHVVRTVCSENDAAVLRKLCQEVCARLIPTCGHACRNRCGACAGGCKNVCDKKVQKRSTCGHFMECRCDELPDQSQCRRPVLLDLNCGHHMFTLCCDRDVKQCEQEVEKVLPCGHRAVLKCSTKAESVVCHEEVTGDPGCGHQQRMQCHEQRTGFKCSKMVNKSLICGHFAEVECCKDVLGYACSTTVTLSLPCGHKVDIDCHLKESNPECKAMCEKKLSCGHVCSGKCNKCKSQGQHEECKKKCEKMLSCSHPCARKCGHNKSCKPCVSKCEVLCWHRKCRKDCGVECEHCKKQCNWKCPHQRRCTKKCHEPCNRLPCDEPCKNRIQSCGHECMGVCGEPCPFACIKCHPTKFPGHRPSTRYIRVQPCNHMVPMEDMDRAMEEELCWGDLFTKIEPKVCPVNGCNKIVLFCPRYGNVIKSYLAVMKSTNDDEDRPMTWLRCTNCQQVSTFSKEELNDLDADGCVPECENC